MNKKTIQTLEFEKILSSIKDIAISDKTVSLINEDLFSTNIDEIHLMINEVDDASTILRHKHVEMSYITDIKRHVKASEIGRTLLVKDFNEIKGVLYRKSQLEKLFQQMEDDEIHLNYLSHYINDLENIHFLYKRINETCDEHTVLSHASSELLKIRKNIERKEKQIRDTLNDLVRGSRSNQLSDSIITMRNNRYVVPVKVEHRSDFKGIVHDMSASGQTVYMEPMVAVQLTNDIQSLKEEESREIERILSELTTEVFNVSETLYVYDDVLHHLDLVFAKAKYGQKINGSRPKVTKEKGIYLPAAFHPLIDSDHVVKNDIFIEEENQAVIITGPNTGGKTVTLKTIGLSVLMAQSGIPIPCRDGGQLHMFESVYSDIGDEQSIEQSLSTFSSHMTNITRIVKVADENSLVLLDELGAGTDPEEGAALGISIIEHLLLNRATIIATTHYPQLKSFSYSRDDVTNASVEFNVNTLSPTYRLLMHIPGKSNAFEISNKLGLDENIIHRARKLIGRDSQEVNKMIDALEKHTSLARENDLNSQSLLRDIEQYYKELKDMVSEYEQYKDKLRKEAREQANRIVKEKTIEADKIIKDLEEMKTLGAENIREHEIIDQKKALENQHEHESIKKNAKNDKKENIQVGDSVDVLSYGQKGDVIDVDGAEAVVQMGIIKMKVPMDELKKRKKAEEKAVVTRRTRNNAVKRSIDLRGERYEDAIIKVDNYLDQVLLSNYETVEIIHGKGTGALQKGIQSYLKTHPKVKSYRGGLPNEGGFGVTIVEMK